MSVILSAQNLSRIYPARRGSIAAVHQVSLEIQPGEFVAVCGRSGSGKSTLMALLGALARPDQGTLHLEGTDLLQLSPENLPNSAPDEWASCSKPTLFFPDSPHWIIPP